MPRGIAFFLGREMLYRAIVSAHAIDIRSGSNGKVIGSASIGDVVDVFDDHNEWWGVYHKGLRGWVHYAALTRIAPEKELSERVVALESQNGMLIELVKEYEQRIKGLEMFVFSSSGWGH